MNLVEIPNRLPNVSCIKDQEAFKCVAKELTVLKTVDNTPKWGWLKHISVSCLNRYPTWEELLELKDRFFGDIDCMMIMPKKSDYVNLHPNCFHIWQTPQEWGLQ